MTKSQRAHAQAPVNFQHDHAMRKEKYVVCQEDSEVPDRMNVRNALDLDAKGGAAAEGEMNSAEERSAAAAAHAHGRAHAYYSRVRSHAVIQVRAAGGFVGAGDRGGEAQGTTTTREFAGVTRI